LELLCKIFAGVRQRSKPLNGRKELRKRARPRSAFRDWRRGVDYRAKGRSKGCPLGLGMDEPRPALMKK